MPLFEYWPLALAAVLVGEVVQRLCISFNVPSWIGYGALGGALALAALVAWWSRVDERRKAREYEEERIAIEAERERLQAHYPHCHATRLTSDEWFLTDRATGREYRPGRPLVVN
ncbi:hypothetical protein [Paraburkholderia sediminicola]|uniref:hypothetical protein n=1 Tax=Paraburkholderia sediminicola TaxID=458836 RepID=UPI0038B7D709